MTISVQLFLDVPFIQVPTRSGMRTLVMDLWLPQDQPQPMPVIVYIHGGGWQGGTQYRPPFRPRFIDQGIAIAAVTYRFSHEALFPAMLHDLKTSVRWLRAHAQEYNLDPRAFGAWGISAGGHLAPLLGLTNNRPDLEGDGPYQEFDSSVQAVCAWCGVMDFPRVAVDPNPGEGLERMVEAVIGGAITENRALAELASPIYQVHPVAPPHLFVHGMEDPVVPAYHSASLHEKLLQHSISSELHLMPGYGHNLDSPETAAVVDAFFNRHLR